MLYWIGLTVGILTLYKYFCWNFNVFRGQGIPGPRPLPVFGTWWWSWTRNAHEIAIENFKKYGRTYCSVRGRVPVLHIQDIDVLKSVLIKDSFGHFSRRFRRPVLTKQEYSTQTVSMLTGTEWKETRNLILAAFSPSVMKERVTFADSSVLEFVEQWKRIAAQEGRIDLKEETEALCEEVMLNYCAGAKLGTLGNPDHPCVLNLRKAMENSGGFLGTVITLYPSIFQWISPFLDTADEYFVDLAKKLLRERLSDRKLHHATAVPDFIDLLIESNKSSHDSSEQERHRKEVNAISQFYMVMQTAYDFGTALTRVLHCLAMNPASQWKCRAEILEGIQVSGNGEISFSLVSQLPFLEKCIHEAHRLYPHNFGLNRVCTKEKRYGNTIIPEGAGVEVPIYMIQRDVRNYPDPTKFDPNRFDKLDPFLYLTFGHGPRSCPARKFSTMVLSHCLIRLLSAFEFFPADNTKDPLECTTGATIKFIAKKPIIGLRNI